MPGILRDPPRWPQPLEIVRPTFPDLDAFSEPLRAALQQGRVTNHGRHVQAFEAALSDDLGVPTLAFSSGQAALMTMLAAADVAGGEVIVPSYTFAATPHAVCWAGARPVFADIDPTTMTLDPDDVVARITARTRAILGVCAYGIPCDYDALQLVGDRHGIPVYYDSAPAFGARRQGRPIGGHGGGQIFSFHATKAFATMEGGALATRDARLFERARALRNFGQHDGADCPLAGLNGKMLEVAAMIGLLQLQTFEAVRSRRLAVAASYRARLAAVPGLRMATPLAGDDPIWLYFPLIVEADAFGLDRDQLCQALQADHVNVRKYFELPCHHMRRYRDGRQPVLPVSERYAYGAVALPVYNDQTEAEMDAVAGAIVDIQRHAGEIRVCLAERIAAE